MPLRNYRESDWDQVWPVVREVVRSADTFTYDPDLSSEQAHETWVIGAPGRTVVAEDGSRILGTAHMDTNRPGPGSHVATASFMVAPDARGLGVGTALVLDAVDWARGRGYAGMQFNAVAASNSRAVALYQRHGFTIVGTVPGAFLHPRLGRVGLHVMYLDLSRAGGTVARGDAVAVETPAPAAPPRATVREVTSADAEEFVERAAASEAFHHRWIVAPRTHAAFERYLARFQEGPGAGYVVCDDTQRIVGFINLNEIVGEPYRRGLLGYGAFSPFEGRGFMRAGLEQIVDLAFTDLGIHRLEADIRPENEASIRLVRSVGFALEALSPGFIRINGEWADHQRWVLLNARS